jgi:aromatase
MAGRTDNAVDIDAPLELAWDMANNVESWTTLFSEYSKVEVLERRGDTVRFRLTMHPGEDGKVWSWISERTADPRTRTVRARRIETGPFEYMHIEWAFVPVDSGVRMRWVQEFTMKPTAPVNDETATAMLNKQTRSEMARIKQLVEEAAAGAPDG